MENNTRPLREDCASAFQYWWRLAIPFWMFRDAARGSTEQRIANYRYNRARRKVLPFYVGKWIGIAVCMMQITRILSDQMAATSAGSGDHLCAALFCMSAGIGFAASCVVIAVLFASYLYLTYVRR